VIICEITCYQHDKRPTTSIPWDNFIFDELHVVRPHAITFDLTHRERRGEKNANEKKNGDERERCTKREEGRERTRVISAEVIGPQRDN